MSDTRKEFEEVFTNHFKENIGFNAYERMYIAWQACQQLNDKRIENYKSAYDTWQEKTEWVQKTAKAKELGMHRADVLKQRIADLLALVARKDEALAYAANNVIAGKRKEIDDALALNDNILELVELPIFFMGEPAYSIKNKP